ncbi:MAG: acetylornithine/succinylornithine family transaminase [Spirochaetes bacterium]|nr:acetylornithine/succinylornithine family transaminase [Spirochaetota bacterium]
MNDALMNTYKRLPATFARGEGSWLFDTDGKKYLDFTSGIAVNCLGHNHPTLVQAINRQAGRLLHTSNYFLSDVVPLFAQKLVEACAKGGMEKVFLANSGAEANEGACKIARKYSLLKYGAGRHTIVTLQGSFHGRTITTLSATGQEKFHKDFGPFTEGFVHIPGGDIKKLDATLDEKTVAGLWIEPVQGESGIVPQTADFVEAAAKLCRQRDILLMADEIQSGLGRTGTFLAIEQYMAEGKAVKADIVTLAKGISGGIPSGAVLAGEKACGVFAPGDHGSTFGGNPLAAAAGLVVLDTVDKSDFMAEIKRKGEKIMAGIRAWGHSGVKEVRGRGLMIGIDIEKEAWPVLEAGLGAGLLMLSGGTNTLRLLPPYTISDGEIEQGLEIMRGLL